MIGTSDRAATALPWLEQHRTAMTAEISKTAQLAALIQNNEHFSPRDLSSDVVALFDKMTARRDQLPTGVEDAGLLLAVYAGIRVIPRFKILFKHKSDRPQVPQKVARTTSSGRGGVWNALW